MKAATSAAAAPELRASLAGCHRSTPVVETVRLPPASPEEMLFLRRKRRIMGISSGS